MAKLIRPAKWFKKARAGNGDEVLKRLENYLNGNFDELVKILCGFWKDQQDAISYQELREAVINGKLDASTWKAWSHDYSVLVSSKLKGVWEEAVKAGSKGQPIMDGLNFSFNPQSAGIMKWITERGADFVTNSTNEQKKAIQHLLAKNVREKHTVDELAKVIRPCIGLTKQQAAANQRYYDNIVETLKKEHPKMKRESIQKKAREAAAKYAERQHRGRAMTIAQTEMAFAYNWGAHEGIKQAQRLGYIGAVVKRWSTAGGDRVCKVCEALEGVEVGMDSKFNISLKAVFSDQHMLPPAHPRCMCAIEYVEAEPVKPLNTPQLSGASDINVGSKHTALNHDEEDALKRYIGSDSYSLNDKLRRNIALTAFENAWIMNLDSALDKMPEYEGTVYRSVSDFGIDDVDEFINSHIVGKTRIFDQYLSSSFDVYDESFPIQYVIKSKRGKDISIHNQGELEVLFKRESKFKIIKIEGNTIYMEETNEI
ncbi:MAG: hypothetical protein HFE90_09220 [Firmicutes bacterium]|nr:hypothetical protein [Bacillota bacterium]